MKRLEMYVLIFILINLKKSNTCVFADIKRQVLCLILIFQDQCVILHLRRVVFVLEIKCILAKYFKAFFSP